MALRRSCRDLPRSGDVQFDRPRHREVVHDQVPLATSATEWSGPGPNGAEEARVAPFGHSRTLANVLVPKKQVRWVVRLGECEPAGRHLQLHGPEPGHRSRGR